LIVTLIPFFKVFACSSLHHSLMCDSGMFRRFLSARCMLRRGWFQSWRTGFRQLLPFLPFPVPRVFFSCNRLTVFRPEFLFCDRVRGPFPLAFPSFCLTPLIFDIEPWSFLNSTPAPSPDGIALPYTPQVFPPSTPNERFSQSLSSLFSFRKVPDQLSLPSSKKFRPRPFVFPYARSIFTHCFSLTLFLPLMSGALFFSGCIGSVLFEFSLVRFTMIWRIPPWSSFWCLFGSQMFPFRLPFRPDFRSFRGFFRPRQCPRRPCHLLGLTASAQKGRS